MKTIRLPSFDRMARYRLASFLFGLVYVMVLSRLAHWPMELPEDFVRVAYFALSTPAIALLGYNLAEASWTIYRTRRRIDKLLDAEQQEQESSP